MYRKLRNVLTCSRKATSLKSQTELGSSYEQQRMELLEPSESCSALFKVLVRIGDRFIFHLSKLYTKPIFTHKNLAVRRIVEAMRTAYAKSGTRSHCASKRMRQTITETYASIVMGKRTSFRNNISESTSKVLLKCITRVSTSFHWYAFPNFCTQITRPPRTVCASHQQLAGPLPCSSSV